LKPFWPLVLVLITGLTGCSSVEPTAPKLRPDDCLKAINLAALPAAIGTCDAVIGAYPKDPTPLKDRALLWSLQGDETKACRDLHQAEVLARRQPPTPSSRSMLADLAVSLRSCPDRSQQR
jgi:regulator of sirC expression with transglutaminase-like and TPR domain